MKNSTISLVSLALIGLVLIQSSAEAYPGAAEQAVRMKVQQLLNMFPNIYEDIRQGRLVPGQFGQQGYLPNQQQGFLPNQNGFVQPGQQGFIPNQQQPFVTPQGQVVAPVNAGR